MTPTKKVAAPVVLAPRSKRTIVPPDRLASTVVPKAYEKHPKPKKTKATTTKKVKKTPSKTKKPKVAKAKKTVTKKVKATK
ncbi:hypothetical protein SAMD00019534_044770 [Acytostelium subglobosum LB1]|uniref:hypothetical protein n=1 Tax=Acytostelium subglobosum LB1 TaxID=1410327 RepID=UPI000644877E|nr:hypothetical protein SAMD00019534_044770 [Acytostelium subglobosum LB1]GAM21302.1 hypothetical protein SAMD00019534_044770 [Acytostelium subglobosum LB1]|eukprot:XP_012755421.1 hypothetical protein SAMD00019534_044770 [Acytostelium subglobosum LB1]